MDKYVVSAFVEQPKAQGIDFGEKIEINGVKIIPQNEGKIKFSVELEGSDDQQVLDDARRRIESIVYALTLEFGTPFKLGEAWIESKVSVSGKQKKIMVCERVALKYSVEVKIRPGAEHLARISKLATKLEHISSERRNLLSRIFKWFYRALIDEDPVDRFIQLYIALEVIGEFKYPQETFTQRVKKVLTDFCDSDIAKEVVGLRGALLHSGTRDKEVMTYIPHMANAILSCAKEIVNIRNKARI